MQCKYLLLLLFVGISLSFGSCSSVVSEKDGQEPVVNSISDEKAKLAHSEVATLTKQFVQSHGPLTTNNAALFEEYVITNASDNLKIIIPHLAFVKDYKKFLSRFDPLQKSFDPQISTSRTEKTKVKGEKLAEIKDNPRIAYTLGPEVTVGSISGPSYVLLNPTEVAYSGFIGTVTYVLPYSPTGIFTDVIDAEMVINNRSVAPGTIFYDPTIAPTQTWTGTYNGQPAAFAQFTMPTWVVPPADFSSISTTDPIAYAIAYGILIAYESVRNIAPIKSEVTIQSSITVSMKYGGSQGTMTTSMLAE
jgi:hypothetical protein